MWKNKINKKILLSFSFSLCLCVALMMANSSTTNNTPSVDSSNLLPGDVIFRLEKNFISNAFAEIDNSEFSHIGIISKDSSGKTMVYHMESTSKGKDLKIQNIDEFLMHAKKFSIYRYASKIDYIKVQSVLFQYSRKNIMFDYDFKLNNGNSNLYCTEFVNEVYKEVAGVDIYKYIYSFGNKKGISIKSIMSFSGLKRINIPKGSLS